MGPVVLDAGVRIAFFSSRDAHHRDATALVRGLLAQRRSLLISAVTYAEVLAHPLRQANEREIDEFLDAITCATADARGAELATCGDQPRDRHAAARGGHTPPERPT